MKKRYLLICSVVICTAGFMYFQKQKSTGFERVYLQESVEEEENEGYDGPAERDALEFEKTKDPALGYVPTIRLSDAIETTENQKKALKLSKSNALNFGWEERGPIYDSVGPSNGNGRGGGTGVTRAYTSGRIRAVLVDTLNDPSGNTVLAGGVAGGLWRTTSFMSESPDWHPIDDRFDNMALSSIAQDPSNPSIMYFSTGEPTSNADAVNGYGVWKSTDKGLTWTRLANTSNFVRIFKLACDAEGNVYMAARVTVSPVAQPYGLMRSKDKGASWQNITPATHTLTSNSSCMDIEITSNGKLHAAFGYNGTVVNHRYTHDPANVTPTTWKAGVGIRTSTVAARRMELAALEDTLYAITVNSSSYGDSLYKSIDGGATWTKQNQAILPQGVTSAQGWYNLTLTINPANSREIMVGGLDAYRSTNSGATVSRVTYWVSSMPYVHADHHFMQWWHKDGESRILIGSDGGLYLSRNAGATWIDKNKGLGIKQFYAAAIHPEAGSNYLLAGAQDNGVHQLKNPGLSYSFEVTGGDGAFVHINQKNPQVQFGSYVYNQYRRSVNGGQTWSGINWSSTNGMFINPFDYDDESNTMFASWTANGLLRWMGAHNSTNNAVALSLPNLGTASAVKVSEYTSGRVFVGSNSGRIFRLDNALATPTITNITGAAFPAGFINSINTGTTDDFLVATYTNYGVNNVWYSTDGGLNWSAIDGNLPDMPVRWAAFFPGHNDKLILATETGIYFTKKVDGNNTSWSPDLSFPTVRTDMIKIRKSDNVIVAATHGRGLYTATIPSTFGPEVNFTSTDLEVTEGAAAANACRGYKDYIVNVSLDVPAEGITKALVSLKAGHTAKKGIDFEITTNGDFVKTSNVLEFAAGAAAIKPVSIRIYDDAEVEVQEEFILELSVEGSTGATPGYNNTFSVKINDVDHAPSVYGNQSYKIGNYNIDIIATSPFAGNRLKHRMQVLYGASELIAAGIQPNTSITAMSVNVLQKNSNKPFKGLTISMANTTAAALTNYVNAVVPATTFMQVYQGDYATVVGNNTFNFSSPFVWDGSSNVVVQYCFDNVPDSSLAGIDVLEGAEAPLGGTVRTAVMANHTVSPPMVVNGCDLPAATISYSRLNATFHAVSGNHIASALGRAKTEYLHTTNDLYYYTSGFEVLGRIKNLSGNDFACTKLAIDRAGNSASRFWNADKRNFLMDKSYQLTSTGKSQSGPYEVTLYFTKEEKEGWEKATGQSWNDIQLVRVSGKISDVTPSNAQPNNNGTVQEVVNAVKGTYGAGYTLTGTFNGFGGIGAGTPGRQYTVLIVKANGNNGNSTARTGTPSGINVEWSTSSETNTTYFTVEKSYDGVNFRNIAKVNAAGNKSSESSYKYLDTENAQVNYYRISLHHADQSVQVSNTVVVRNDAATQQMFVLTNPFRNDIRLRFARVPESQVVVRLFDQQGRLVKSQTSPAGSNLLTIDMSAVKTLSTGIYELDVIIDGKHYKSKLAKQ